MEILKNQKHHIMTFWLQRRCRDFFSTVHASALQKHLCRFYAWAEYNLHLSQTPIRRIKRRQQMTTTKRQKGHKVVREEKKTSGNNIHSKNIQKIKRVYFFLDAIVSLILSFAYLQQWSRSNEYAVTPIWKSKTASTIPAESAMYDNQGSDLYNNIFLYHVSLC